MWNLKFKLYMDSKSTSLKLYKASLKSSSHDNIIFYDEICIGWLSGSSGTLLDKFNVQVVTTR